MSVPQPTPRQLRQANKKLAEMKRQITEVAPDKIPQAIADIVLEKDLLETLRPQEVKLQKLEGDINAKKDLVIACVLRGDKKSSECSGGIIVDPKKPKQVQRYRPPTQAEKDLKKQKAELERALQREKDWAIVQSQTTLADDPNVAKLVADLAILERDHNEETAKLAEKIKQHGLNLPPNLRDIANARAEKVSQIAELEGRQKALKQQAEMEWKKSIAVTSTVRTDRDIMFLVTDVMAMRNWMIDGSPGLSAREQMHKLEHQQAIGVAEFALVENLIVYSKNQERVVHCAKKDGKWDFATYYTQCGLEYAQQQFAKCQGRTVSALPDAPSTSDFVSATL